MNKAGKLWRPWLWIPLAFLLLAGLVILLNSSTGLPHLLPPAFRDPLKAAVILIVGSVLSAFIERVLFRKAPGMVSARHVTTVRFMIRLGLYLAIGLAVLAAFGVGLSSVVFGGAFLTVILGLAGQSLFQNLLGGIWLVFFHPFEVGDLIEVVAWQFPILMPSFPHEQMRPAYVGRVRDLSLMYTTMEMENGIPIMIPSGILVQAAISNRSRTHWRVLRVRFDIPATVGVSEFIQALEQKLPGHIGFKTERPPEVLVVDLAKDTSSVLVLVRHREDNDDRARHRVLEAAAQVQQELMQKAQGQEAGARASASS